MTLKVISTACPRTLPYRYSETAGLYRAFSMFEFSALLEIDGVRGSLSFFHHMGCPYNGISNPLGWPVKNYYNDAKKDLCGDGHDCLYAHGGEVEGLGRKLTPGECDDFLRGSMREAGLTRFKAGLVDRMVRIPLVHLLHFGKDRDKEGMHLSTRLEWKEVGHGHR